MTQEDIQELRESIDRDRKTVELHRQHRNYKRGDSNTILGKYEMIDVNSIGTILDFALTDLSVCLDYIEELQEKLRVTEEELDITLRNNCYREN